jgi:hypothetical protein
MSQAGLLPIFEKVCSDALPSALMVRAMPKSTAALEIARKLIVTPVGVTDLGPLSKALNVKLDGILGQDVLSQFGSVTVDYKNRQLIFEM